MEQFLERAGHGAAVVAEAIALAWIGVGAVYPAASTARRRAAGRPSWSKDM